jgi:hypothetical protein
MCCVEQVGAYGRVEMEVPRGRVSVEAEPFAASIDRILLTGISPAQ